MARILITGINGFFGRNLVKRWIGKHEMIGLDLPPQLFDMQSMEPYMTWHESINHCDLREDVDYIKDLLKNVDIVLHCAARTRIDPSWQEFEDYYTTNVSASQSLFRACQRQGIKKFVYFSSSSVYGNNPNQFMNEDDPLMPTNPYAVSKMAAEHALRVQALKGETELIVVRPFTMYGDYMNFGTYSLVIAKFLKALDKDVPLLLEGGGTQERDFVHAHDAIRALELIMEHGKHGDVYNIGTGKTVTIKEIADLVSHKQVVGPSRTGAIQRTCADITRLKELGYTPKIELLNWLTNYIADFKLKIYH